MWEYEQELRFLTIWILSTNIDYIDGKIKHIFVSFM